MKPAASRRLQPEFFSCPSPLVERFGGAFFRDLPVEPGVYFFYDEEGVLLYIGQSSCLRKRLGSYRFVRGGTHPRRLPRLIHRVRRIEFQTCQSAAEALALEAFLILRERPSFNRAGVWKPGPQRALLRLENGFLEARLAPVDNDGEAEINNDEAGADKSAAAGGWIGPLPGGFRYTFAAWTRVLFSQTSGSADPAGFPVGMMNGRPAICHSWRVSRDPVEVHSICRDASRFLLQKDLNWLEATTSQLSTLSDPAHREYWDAQLDLLRKFAGVQALPVPPQGFDSSCL